MLAKRSVNAVLDRDFLEIRARLLDLASTLDRIDRADGGPSQLRDSRLTKIRSAIEALAVPEPDRAKTVQHIFSLEYDPDWQTEFGIAGNRGATSHKR
jgi:hypothetical protein